MIDQIGQGLIVGFEGTSPEDASVQTLLREIRDGYVGGVILFSRNAVSLSQVKELTQALKEAAIDRPPLFIAIDQEGGAVQRLQAKNGFRDYMTPKDIAQQFSPSEAKTYYLHLAYELKDCGFNLNFSPCVDLDLGCPVISGINRSYGREPASVVAFAKAVIEAHQEAGILTCIKHFPGHGTARQDSHLGMVDITEVWASIESEPFRALIEQGLSDMVMTAHLVHRTYDKNNPLSMTPGLIQTLLREDFAFEGVVIVDDLHMGAIQEHYPDLKTVVQRALLAGNDILLFSNNPQAAPRLNFTGTPDLPAFYRRTVTELLEREILFEKSLHKSLSRIAKLKKRISRL